MKISLARDLEVVKDFNVSTAAWYVVRLRNVKGGEGRMLRSKFSPLSSSQMLLTNACDYSPEIGISMLLKSGLYSRENVVHVVGS